MQVCPKCGNELTSDMLYCPNCGSAVTSSVGNSSNLSERYMRIVKYKNDLTAPLVMAIIGLVCSLGVGVIFAFIAQKMLRKVYAPINDNLTPREEIIYEKARKKAYIIKLMITTAKSIFSFAVSVLIFLIVFSPLLAPCFV